MPAISNMMRPGLTTATHFSGAPLPLPMRVSAGFLVYGLSGKMRIHNLPPRLMKRVMATRDASIWRSVIQAFSMAFSPYSPKAKLPPRQALPLRRPRCCFLYFTFFGINIALFSLLSILANRRARRLALRYSTGLKTRHYESLRNGDRGLVVFPPLALGNVFSLIDPALHANHAVGGLRFRSSVIDVRAEGLQRQTALQVPFLAGDFRAVQTAGDANFNALATETQRGVHGLAHGAAEGDALFKLQRDGFRNERSVQFRAVHFDDVNVHFAL